MDKWTTYFSASRTGLLRKRKSEIFQLTEVKRVTFLHRPYNIMSHFYWCCKRRPAGEPDCWARDHGFNPHVDQSNNQGVEIIGAIMHMLAVCSMSGSVQFSSSLGSDVKRLASFISPPQVKLGWGAKEPTHWSKRVGYVVPGVLVCPDTH